MASAATEADQPLYTTLSSNDGFDFHILRSAAVQSETIRRMLSPTLGFREATTNHCVFREITYVPIVFCSVCAPWLRALTRSQRGRA